MSLIDLLGASPPFFIGTCLVFGLLVGSFLNVVIYRVPGHAGASVARAMRELAATTRRAPRPAGTGSAALQPRRAPLGLPGVQSAHYRDAKHPGAELSVSARPLRGLRRPYQRPLSGDRSPHRRALRGGRLEIRLRLARGGGARAHLVPDRAHLHRRGSPAPARQPHPAPAVDRPAAEPLGAPREPARPSPWTRAPASSERLPVT